MSPSAYVGGVRWLIPAAVGVAALGVFMLYVVPWKDVALIDTPGAAYVLVVAGAIGIVVGVARGSWSRSSQLGVAAGTGSDAKVEAKGGNRRFADAIALAGLALAPVALLAFGSFFFYPLLVSLQGPDPCGGAKGVRQPDTACLLAHPDYYEYDPDTGSLSTRAWRISQTVDAVAWPAAIPLTLVAALISWLALAMGTRRRRAALSGMSITALIVVGLVFFRLILIGGGGD